MAGSKVLIIGAGGVGGVVAHKCAQGAHRGVLGGAAREPDRLPVREDRRRDRRDAGP
jgi:saccharopine dehydrogenase-like NADP-dependent oxidoreductase